MAKRSNGEGSAGWVTINRQKYWLKDFQNKYVNNSDTSTLGNFMYNWLWNVKKPALKPSTFERWEGLNNKKIADLDTMYLQKA